MFKLYGCDMKWCQWHTWLTDEQREAEGEKVRCPEHKAEQIIDELKGIHEAFRPENVASYGSQYVLLDGLREHAAELWCELVRDYPDKAREFDPDAFDEVEAYEKAYDDQYGEGAWKAYCQAMDELDEEEDE